MHKSLQFHYLLLVLCWEVKFLQQNLYFLLLQTTVKNSIYRYGKYRWYLSAQFCLFYKNSWLIIFAAYTHKTNISQLLKNNWIYQYMIIYPFIKYLHNGQAKERPRRKKKNVMGSKNKNREAEVSTIHTVK